MIKLNTSRFGELEVDEGRVINFHAGLIGLPELKKFILIDHKDTAIKWLQAIDDPDMAFIVTAPDTLVDNYSIELDRTSKRDLDLNENNEELAILVILRVEGEDLKANFRGPLLINPSVMKGIQIVIDTPESHYQKAV